MRKVFASGLAALAITGGSVAVAAVDPMGLAGAAQEEDSPSETPDTGAPGDPTLRSRHGRLLEEALAGLVDEGVLTDEQADAVTERVRELAQDARTERRSERLELLDDVAELLELTPEEIREQLRDGATLAEIAGDQLGAVLERLVEEARERIDEAVAEGRLDAERADELLERIEERITEFVNGERDGRGRHHWPRHHGPSRPGTEASPEPGD